MLAHGFSSAQSDPCICSVFDVAVAVLFLFTYFETGSHNAAWMHTCDPYPPA